MDCNKYWQLITAGHSIICNAHKYEHKYKGGVADWAGIGWMWTDPSEAADSTNSTWGHTHTTNYTTSTANYITHTNLTTYTAPTHTSPTPLPPPPTSPHPPSTSPHPPTLPPPPKAVFCLPTHITNFQLVVYLVGYMYVYFIFINLILSIYEYGSLTICERPSACSSEVQYKYFHCGSCSIGVVGPHYITGHNSVTKEGGEDWMDNNSPVTTYTYQHLTTIDNRINWQQASYFTAGGFWKELSHTECRLNAFL